ncbi:MAG: aminotransferase class I/II-fold pyridoxal phosphate-dependent enzyme [Phycisphaerales bacterium]|nr:aminotransferase class I/II-fold pyridoxal phosphate-dependent enzyme [Phycisphaerales bacterium]
MRTFRSDNNAGLTPEAMRAVAEANDRSHQIGYGDDAYTERAVEAFRKVFGKESAVFFVATGSAANTLAVASLTQPWQQVLCHPNSHFSNDESTAPERLTHCRVTTIRTDSTKIVPSDLERMVYSRGDVHQPQPGILTISNTTELGTVYTPAEVKALCKTAHAAGFRVHVDGARFANAVAALECDPRAITNDAGVDALSFGGTKNGLAYGEAVLFFPQGDGAAQRQAVEAFPYQRKSSGHLLSKHRFVSAPFAATLSDGSWLKHARHANAMAKELARGLQKLGMPIKFPAEANAIFVQLPAHVDEALQRKGHGYYPFGDPAWNVTRLMCSFDTTAEDVRGFLADVEAALPRAAAATARR